MEYDEFVRDWFMTFHIFLKPAEFLKLLRSKYTSALEDYEAEEGADIIESVIHILQLWVDLEKGADFFEGSNLRSTKKKKKKKKKKTRDLKKKIVRFFSLDAELTRQFNDFVDLIAKKDAKVAAALKETLAGAIETLQNPPQPDVHNAPQPQVSKKKFPPGVVPPLTEIEVRQSKKKKKKKTHFLFLGVGVGEADDVDGGEFVAQGPRERIPRHCLGEEKCRRNCAKFDPSDQFEQPAV